jgi:integrase
MFRPIPPAFIALLRAHLKRYGSHPADGRLFRTACGEALQDSAYSAVWHTACTAALTPPSKPSPLVRCPYDLRHAAASLWLMAGGGMQRLLPRTASIS